MVEIAENDVLTSSEKRRKTIADRKASGTWNPKARTHKKPTVVDIVESLKVSKEAEKQILLSQKLDKSRIQDGYATLDGYFKVSEGTYNILRNNILEGESTMLLGPTGAGKTELVAGIAKELGLDLTIIDMGTMMDPIMGLVGSHIIHAKDGSTTSTFAKARFSQVIEKPGIVLLDEINRATIMANNLLLPCLDFRRELAMEYNFENPEPIKMHPDCIILSTANVGSQYVGTKKMDPAVLDRFMLLEVEVLDQKNTQNVLYGIFPTISVTTINSIVGCYFEINKAHEEFTISFELSMRHLKRICKLAKNGFSIYDSFYTLCKGIGGKDGLKALETVLNKIK